MKRPGSNPREGRMWMADVPGALVPAVVNAPTKSEARARLKKRLGVKSLPPYTVLTHIQAAR